MWTKSVLILNWITWIRTVSMNWIVWNRNVFYNWTVYPFWTELFEIEFIIYIKMDLALNNIQSLICHKTQQTNQPTTNPSRSGPGCNSNLGVLLISQTSKTRVSPSDTVLYHNQNTHWRSFTPLQRCSQRILQSQSLSRSLAEITIKFSGQIELMFSIYRLLLILGARLTSWG